MSAFLIIGVFATLLASCSKDDGGILGSDDKPACERYKEGNIRVVNNQDDPYDISVDGTFRFKVNGHSSKTIEGISADGHAFYAIQKSGFIFSPTEYSSTVVVTQCETAGVELN